MNHKNYTVALIIALAAMFGIGSACVPVDSFAAKNDPAELQVEANSFDFEKGEALNEFRDAAEDLPHAYDLRHVPAEDAPGAVDENGDGEVSFVTPVRLQNPYGTCWGFAAAGAAESSLLSSGVARRAYLNENTLDLSEKHIAYFANSFIDDPDDPQYGEGVHFRNIPKKEKNTYAYMYNTGGVTYMATSLFASGIGPVLESVKPEELSYRGKRGEKAYWEVATKYTRTGEPLENSYRSVPVWFSDQDDWSILYEDRDLQSFRMKDTIVLPDPAKYEDGDYQLNRDAIDAIKQQISREHRAVSISFCAESYLPGQDTSGKLYMSDKWAHFTNVPEFANHSVTIVGYDDDYPRGNFASTTDNGGPAQPEGDGAFLIKNSWGSELNAFPANGNRHWGLLEGCDRVPYLDGQWDEPEITPSDETLGARATGYFWISYYDRSLNDPEAFVFDAYMGNQAKSYAAQMDYMDAMYVLNHLSDDADAAAYRMANVFETQATSFMNGISVVTTVPGTTVNYKVYLLGEGYQGPEDGILINEGEESFQWGGYHRIALGKPRVLTKGQQYSVVITETCEDDSYVPYPATPNDDSLNFYSVGVINEGESFFFDGAQWKDLSLDETKQEVASEYTDYEYAIDNFPIKSYLDPITAGAPDNAYLTIHNWQDNNPGTFTVLSKGEQAKKTLTAEIRGEMPSNWDPVFSWVSEDEDILKVTPKDTPGKGQAVIEGVGSGTTHLIVYAGRKGSTGVNPEGYPDNFGVRVLTIKVNKPKLDKCKIHGSELDPTYTGEEIKPRVVGVWAEDGSTDLVEGTDYTVSYKNNIDAGTGTFVVTGIGDYDGELSGEFRIYPAGNTLNAAGKTAVIKYSPKAQTLDVSKAINFDSKGEGPKTYTKKSGNKKITVTESGKITIGKGLEKGSYEVVIIIKAAGDRNHEAKSQTVTAKIKVDPAANTLKIKGKSAAVQYSKIKKKSQKLSVSKVIKFSNKGQGTKTYAKVSGNKKITIAKKTGKVTVQKGLAKGTYKVKVKVTAKGNKNYKAGTKQTTITIRVR